MMPSEESGLTTNVEIRRLLALTSPDFCSGRRIWRPGRHQFRTLAAFAREPLFAAWHAPQITRLLTEAVAPVFRDLRRATMAVPQITEADWSGGPDVVTALLVSSDGSSTGVHVSRSTTEAERVAELADQVQEWAIEQLWGHGPTNWPPCTLHPNSHPLTATTRESLAVWACPIEDVVIAPIGGV